MREAELEKCIFDIVQSDSRLWRVADIAKKVDAEPYLVRALLDRLFFRGLVGRTIYGDYRRGLIVFPAKEPVVAEVLYVTKPMKITHGAPNSYQRRVYDACGVLVEMLSFGFVPTLDDNEGLKIARIMGEPIIQPQKDDLRAKLPLLRKALKMKTAPAALIGRYALSRKYDPQQIADVYSECFKIAETQSPTPIAEDKSDKEKDPAWRATLDPTLKRLQLIALACTFAEFEPLYISEEESAPDA